MLNRLLGTLLGLSMLLLLAVMGTILFIPDLRRYLRIKTM